MNLEQIALSEAQEMDDVYLRNVPADVLRSYARRLVATLEAQEPGPCICCANGNDLPDGEWCRACNRTNEGKLSRAVRLARGSSEPPNFPVSFDAAPPICPTVPDGWVAVEDGLPDANGVFLVVCDRGVQAQHPIIGVFRRDFDSPYPWAVPGTAQVTHWMPLPAAPEYKKP